MNHGTFVCLRGLSGSTISFAFFCTCYLKKETFVPNWSLNNPKQSSAQEIYGASIDVHINFEKFKFFPFVSLFFTCPSIYLLFVVSFILFRKFFPIFLFLRMKRKIKRTNSPIHFFFLLLNILLKTTFAFHFYIDLLMCQSTVAARRARCVLHFRRPHLICY